MYNSNPKRYFHDHLYYSSKFLFILFFSFFQYDCLNAPLNVENDPFAWWTDRHDNTHIYWTGDGQEVYKGCQCGLKVRKKNVNLS